MRVMTFHGPTIAVAFVSAYWLVVLPVLANETSDLDKAQSCVQQLKDLHRDTHRWCPSPLWSLDRKLKFMSDGIAAIEKNNLLMRRLMSQPETTSAQRIMVANSVIGCQSYLASFQRHVTLLERFFFTAIGFLAFTTVLMFVGALGALRMGRSQSAPVEDKNFARPQESVEKSDKPGIGLG